MTSAYNNPDKEAYENATCSIAMNRHFPQNVFVDGWTHFRFFHADWIFEREFVGKMQKVLKAEGGTCVCLINLYTFACGKIKESSFFIDDKITGDAYLARLNGPSVTEAWISRMDRFSCASDTGQWSFYCEKDNEIAVIAIRENRPKTGFDSIIQQFGAMPIGQAVENPLTYGLSAGLPEWRATLIKAYAEIL